MSPDVIGLDPPPTGGVVPGGVSQVNAGGMSGSVMAPPLPSDRLQVCKDLARGVRPRTAGDAAAGVAARTGEVEAGDRRSVAPKLEARPPGEPLVERRLAVERMAAGHA